MRRRQDEKCVFECRSEKKSRNERKRIEVEPRAQALHNLHISSSCISLSLNLTNEATCNICDAPCIVSRSLQQQQQQQQMYPISKLRDLQGISAVSAEIALETGRLWRLKNESGKRLVRSGVQRPKIGMTLQGADLGVSECTCMHVNALESLGGDCGNNGFGCEHLKSQRIQHID
jgi:hypothetical protein